MKKMVQDREESSTHPDFERLFRKHAGMVYRTAFAILADAADADDILQTVFLRLLRRDISPDLATNPEAYLYRAAVNLALDTLKARRRQPQRTDDPEHVEAPPSATPAFDDAMHDRLYEAIAELPPATAEIVILRYVYNISDANIAKKLDLARTTVAVRLFRARALLKKIIRRSEKELYESR